MTGSHWSIVVEMGSQRTWIENNVEMIEEAPGSGSQSSRLGVTVQKGRDQVGDGAFWSTPYLDDQVIAVG